MGFSGINTWFIINPLLTYKQCLQAKKVMFWHASILLLILSINKKPRAIMCQLFMLTTNILR